MEKVPFSLHARVSKSGKKVFYCQFRGPDGRLGSAISTGQTSRVAARRWAEDRVAKSGVEVKAMAKEGKMALRVWAERFYKEGCPHCSRLAEEGKPITTGWIKASRRYMETLVLVDGDLADQPLARITRNELLEFRTRSLARTTVVQTNRAISLLKVILREAYFRGIIPNDPTQGIGQVQHKAKPKAILTTAEIRLLLDRRFWISDLAHLAFVTIVMTGMRTGEMRALHWDQVDFTGRRITISRAVKNRSTEIGSPKNGKPRVTALPAALADAFRSAHDLAGKPANGLIFHREGKVMPVYWFHDCLRGACYAAGLEPEGRSISPHALRHTVATRLLDAGADPRKVQAALGWQSTAIMDNYTHSEAFDYSALGEILEAPADRAVAGPAG